MVFLDIGQVHEIDNELILFRELLKMNSEYYNSLLISQGGRITQHMVEFLVRNKRNIYHNIYNSNFEDFLDKCDFIPTNIRKVILEINTYRRDAVYSIKDEYELNEFILDYFKAFKIILIWFYRYCYKYFGFNRFDEIKSTFTDLKEKINNPEEINKHITTFEPDLEENFSNGNDIKEMKSAIFELVDSVKRIDKRTEDINETTQDTNRIAQDTNETTHIIDNKVDQIHTELRQLNANIAEYKNDVHELLKNAPSEEEREKIISEFTNKCVKKIRNSFEITNVDDYGIEKENLIESLGEPAWNKLSEQSKTFLITAKITFHKINELEDIIDYSGVCLLVTKALEVELSKRFFKGFKKIFKDKPITEYHTSLLDRKKNYVLKDNKCTLGTITYIFGQNEDKVPKDEYDSNLLKVIDYSKNNYFKDLDDEKKVKEKIIYYGELVENIRVKYRNPAAHTKELKCPTAKECFNCILDAKQVLKIMLDSFDK